MADGQPMSLGARAFDVLQALIEHRERIVTKNELLDLAWPGVVVEENNLQVQISTLRKLLRSAVDCNDSRTWLPICGSHRNRVERCHESRAAPLVRPLVLAQIFRSDWLIFSVVQMT